MNRLKGQNIWGSLICLVVFLLITGLRVTGSLEALELYAYDWFITLSPRSPVATPVVLIGVTDSDMRHLGRWPISDADLANILSILLSGSPRAIGVDIFRDIPVPPGTEELNSVLQSSSNIIWGMKFGGKRVPGPPGLKDTSRIGFNDLLVDPGGIMRRGLLFMDDGETVTYSFALRLALLYLRAENIFPEPDPDRHEHLKLGKNTIRPLELNEGGYAGIDDRGYQFLVDFREDRSSFPLFSLRDLLAREFVKDSLKGKVVILGSAAQGVKDFFYTPHSRSLKDNQEMPGILLHGHMVSQLIRVSSGESPPITGTSDVWGALWIFFWCFVGVVVGSTIYSAWRFFLLMAAGTVAISLAGYLIFLYGFWIPTVSPCFALLSSSSATTVCRLNEEKRKRAMLMQLFCKHVSKEVAEQIWQQRDHLLEGSRVIPQKLVATILILDLKGFKAISESMDEMELIGWLNIYLEKMTQIIIHHGGVVDDYAGDGIKANFGVPIARITEGEIGRDALNAVNCALSMKGEMVRSNLLLREQQRPFVGMRIVIVTGPVVAGTVGSPERMKYTTVGKIVNLAFQLEKLAKDCHFEDSKSDCEILISETTWKLLDGRFEAQEIADAGLGQAKTTIYRLIG